MKRALPLITLAAAALGGACMGKFQPKPLVAQEATCSIGSDLVCREVRTCTERAWNISLKSYTFGFGACLSWYTDTLYLREYPLPGSSSGDKSEDDPGDDDQANGEGVAN